MNKNYLPDIAHSWKETQELINSKTKTMKQAKTTKQPLEETFLYTVTNIDGVVKHFISDESFLEYVKKVYKENEDGQPYPSEIHWMPENIQQAKEYIHEYCSNLELEEHPTPDSKEGLHTQDDAEKILTKIYAAFGTDSGILFGIKEKAIVETIIKFTLKYSDERKALLDALDKAWHVVNLCQSVKAWEHFGIDKDYLQETLTAINNAKNI